MGSSGLSFRTLSRCGAVGLSLAGGTWEEVRRWGAQGRAATRRDRLSSATGWPGGFRRPGLKAGDPARPLPRAGRPRAGSSPAPAAGRLPGISRRARFRRWQRWFSPERPAMAGAPGPLRLALLLLGAVGRAGPRPQVRPRSPGQGGGGSAAGGGSWLGRRDLSETPRPQADGPEASRGVGSGELAFWAG